MISTLEVFPCLLVDGGFGFSREGEWGGHEKKSIALYSWYLPWFSIRFFFHPPRLVGDSFSVSPIGIPCGRGIRFIGVQNYLRILRSDGGPYFASLVNTLVFHAGARSALKTVVGFAFGRFPQRRLQDEQDTEDPVLFDLHPVGSHHRHSLRLDPFARRPPQPAIEPPGAWARSSTAGFRTPRTVPGLDDGRRGLEDGGVEYDDLPRGAPDDPQGVLRGGRTSTAPAPRSNSPRSPFRS